MTQPKNWPKELIYTKKAFSTGIHPHFLAHLLFTGNEEDQEKVHPLIENGLVHSGIEIQEIIDSSHPLANKTPRERGIFAAESIPKGSDLGTYVGEIILMNKDWGFKPGNYDYALVIHLNGGYYYRIEGKKWANEMVLINDYRGIAKEPNVTMKMIPHLGYYYPMFSTSCEIIQGEELLWDYGDNYWKMRKVYKDCS